MCGDSLDDTMDEKLEEALDKYFSSDSDSNCNYWSGYNRKVAICMAIVFGVVSLLLLPFIVGLFSV